MHRVWLALGSSLAFAGLGPSVVHAQDCQTRLEAAIQAITGSGPMRARITYTASAHSQRFDTLEMVDVTRVRWLIEETFSKEMVEMRRQFGEADTFKLDSIIVGDVELVTRPKSGERWGYPTSPSSASAYLRNAMLFADPKAVFAKACEGKTISYVYNGTLDGDPNRSFAERDGERRAADARMIADGLRPSSVNSKLVLDEAGVRPIRLEQEDASTERVQWKGISVTFDYDPKILVEIPKVDYKFEKWKPQ